MKIKSIAAHYSTPKHIALCTTPPLTEEVFAAFKSASPRIAGFAFAFDSGLLLVRPPEITADAVSEFNEHLNTAENYIKKKNEPGEKRRKEFLDRISAATGLPVK